MNEKLQINKLLALKPCASHKINHPFKMVWVNPNRINVENGWLSLWCLWVLWEHYFRQGCLPFQQRLPTYGKDFPKLKPFAPGFEMYWLIQIFEIKFWRNVQEELSGKSSSISLWVIAQYFYLLRIRIGNTKTEWFLFPV